jgi:hypothetical protein
MALTAHWIAKNKLGSLELKAALIGFHRLRGGHDGKSMANAVIGLLDRAEITMKVSMSTH